MRAPDSSTSADPKPWRWLLLNVLVLPGLGTIKAGRRRIGNWQLVLGLIGFIVSTAAAVQIALSWVRALANGLAWRAEMRPVWLACAGLVLFFISWFWALATSIELMRRPPQATAPPAA